MLKQRQIISFFLLSLYFLVFVHNAIPHSHKENGEKVEIKLSSFSDLLGDFSHVGGENHLAHTFQENDFSIEDKDEVIRIFVCIKNLFLQEFLEEDTHVLIHDDGGSLSDLQSLTIFGLRAPPAMA